jgi:pimeloyl-ACP methyl ester carboxylesterase
LSRDPCDGPLLRSAAVSDDFSRATRDDGQTFVFTDKGSGPLVVLFHGFPDTPYGWDAIGDRLVGAGYRVVAPWLRGYHPETLVEGRGYGAEVIGRDAIRLLDALGAQSAVLVGHDWGAGLVYGGASLAPERVRAIVPIDIPHTSLLKPSLSTMWGVRHFLALRLPWAERSVARTDFAYLDTLYRRWAPNWSGSDRDDCLRRVKECFAEPSSLTGALAYYRALSPRPAASVAKPPAVRGLVVGGTGMLDPALYEKTAQILAPGSTSAVMDGTGHWPHREAQDRFVDALIGFLDGLGPESAGS